MPERRDLGGLPTGDGDETQWQSIVRTDYLGRLSRRPTVHARLRRRTVIDIRSPQEVGAASYQIAEPDYFLRHHLPIEVLPAC